MQQIGIDISGAEPKIVFDLYKKGRIFDYVIAVCDEATAEQCPVFPGICERIQWGFPDPSELQGDRASKLTQVAGIRNAIRDRIDEWLRELEQRGSYAPVVGRRPAS
jgi:arsenate reductase